MSRWRNTGSNLIEYRSTTSTVWPASRRPAVNCSSTAWQNDFGFGWAYTVRTLIDTTAYFSCLMATPPNIVSASM